MARVAEKKQDECRVSVELPREIARFIQKQIQRGLYADELEVVNEALRRHKASMLYCCSN